MKPGLASVALVLALFGRPPLKKQLQSEALLSQLAPIVVRNSSITSGFRTSTKAGGFLSA